MPQLPDSIPDWQRAHGCPLFAGTIRQSARDFEVTEILGFAPTGCGEHDFLWVEKNAANSAWVAEKLARHAGIRDLDVGYAGRKDRNAVTRQWFSVRRPTGAGTDWQSFDEPGVSILEVDRHDKKLRTGAHKANRFRIAVRDMNVTRDELTPWLKIIREGGVPNYFGEQRFGRNGNNMSLASALFAGKRLQRNKRSIAISAARSYLFNEILQARVRRNTWNTATTGEAFNLDGTNSIFVEDELTAELNARLDSLDIHPTAALWGSGELACRDEAASLERDIAASFDYLCSGLDHLGVKQGRRATRLVVRDLSSAITDDALWLEFVLSKGGYATSVLREIVA